MSDYYIWSHEHGAWWRQGGGYTKSMTSAGVYSQAKALEICSSAIIGTAARLGALPELPVSVSDAKFLRSTYRAQFSGTVRTVEKWE